MNARYARVSPISLSISNIRYDPDIWHLKPWAQRRIKEGLKPCIVAVKKDMITVNLTEEVTQTELNEEKKDSSNKPKIFGINVLLFIIFFEHNFNCTLCSTDTPIM